MSSGLDIHFDGGGHPRVDGMHTDTVAEIQNTLRAGTDVKLSEVEIVMG